jgi:molecular chaperone DnaK
LQNVPVGKFTVEGLAPVEGANEVLCRMRLDLDGILHVTAIEKKTGLSKHIAITGATRPRNAAEMTRGREQLDKLFAGRVVEDAQSVVQEAPVESDEAEGFPAAMDIPPAPAAESADTPPIPAVAGPAIDPAALVARCRARISSMHADDQEEALGLIEDVEAALAASNRDALTTASAELGEFLFFVEGR